MLMLIAKVSVFACRNLINRSLVFIPERIFKIHQIHLSPLT